MYNPTEEPDQFEYIEMYNPTGSTVNMWNIDGSWEIDGGVNYTFPASTSLSSGQRILIVDFDPWTETSRLADFEATYSTGSLTAGTDIFGPWSGSLSNSGERITLEMPEEIADIYWIIVDEVIYGDYSPWPTSPDGDGDALRRESSAMNGEDSGWDPDNWEAATPSPGS
jgi:hypothetical protein